ncbi:MAG: aminotransferase class I/II-fold pyridoxal phosphate-dependent enzyme, partial [Ignavibacteriales bacterium]
RWLLDAMAAVASETYTATSAPIQFAAVRAFKGGLKIENYLWNCRIILRRLSKLIVNKLNNAGISVTQPDGAFYLFPDFILHKNKFDKKKIITSFDLADKLLEETGVAILPGIAFGRPETELTARIAYVDFDGVRALSAAEQAKSEKEIDNDFLETYCGNTIDAIDRICDWVK